MTKKDHQLIANIVGKIRNKSERAAVTCDFCDELKLDNPRFDDGCFIMAVHEAAGLMYGKQE